MLGYLLQGLSWGLYAGILPGPTQAFILSKTIQNGWARTLPLALVPLVSDLPIALLFCLLVSTLPMNLINIIQIIGGGYLVYLGIQTWKAANTEESPQRNSEQPAGFWQTVVINFTNPNVYVYWGTIGAPKVLEGWADRPASGLAFIIGMYTMLVLVVAGTIVLFGLTGKLPVKAKYWTMRFLAVAVVFFAAYQVIAGISNLMRV